MTPPVRPLDARPAGHDPVRQWSTNPTPPEPKPKRGGRILLAAAIGVVLLVATGCVTTTDTEPDPTPPPTEVPKEDPMPEPEPAPEGVEVPELSGITQERAEQILADRGLKATTRSRSTDQYRAGTVISQTPKAGAEVLPDTTISLVVAKTPPAPEPPPPPPPEPVCDPSYPDVCLDPTVEDYDCASGSGNGPAYVEGPIRVRPPDPFDLDREGDGVGCET
jgi:hypothetical protein